MSDHDQHEEDGRNSDHWKQYLAVFAALSLLTGASFFTYSDLWPFKAWPAVGWTFMMMVSCCKAMLVLLFFMHLKHEASWKWVLTIPASVMAVFLVLMLFPDVKWRFEKIIGGRTISDERRQHIYWPPEVTDKEPSHQPSPKSGD